MIALIRGNIIRKTLEYVIIETNGIGYRVFLPTTALGEIGIGETHEIFTYLNVREDALLLYGFLREVDKEIFTKLLGISGLGPKTALAVVSNVSSEKFMQAVQEGDSDTFSKVPGIGKKTAQRIILELKGKVDLNKEEAIEKGSNAMELAVEALTGLGYTRNDIKTALSKIENKALAPEEIIRQALKILAKV